MSLPLWQYHRDQHSRAGPIPPHVFGLATTSTPFSEQLGRIVLINTELCRLNILNNLDPDLGVIDTSVFLYVLKEESLGHYLEDFCRLRHYPVEWAHQRPKDASTYQPYEHPYWEDCDWFTPTLLLSFIWRLRKGMVELEIVEDHEVILMEFECKFNRRVSQLHMSHGNSGSTVGFLRTDIILQRYIALAYHLETKDKGQYEDCQENLRIECALYGYSSNWVPGAYVQQTNITEDLGFNHRQLLRY